jgi:SAM-dependent methyltransferase
MAAPDDGTIDIRQKMRDDWDRRARVDPRYWVAATAEADEESYQASAERDGASLLDGLRGRLGPEARALDLGCGIGRLSAQIAGRFAEVVGVDVSPAMIEAARALHAGRAGLRFEANSGNDLANFPADAFDLVFSYSVLPHLPPDVLESYFLEVGRVLRPGGWFRYQFWIGPAHDAAAADTLTIRVYDRETFLRLNADAGLTVAEIDEIDYLDPVLQLKPVWVNAQKTGRPARTVPELARRHDAAAPEERELEYGLLLYLAVKHDERGDVGEAERVLEQCVALDPARPEAYIQWSRHRLDQDDVEGGLKLLEALTEAVPDCAPGWLYRAQFAEALGDKAAATVALDRLAALRATEPEIRKEAQAMRRRLRGGR